MNTKSINWYPLVIVILITALAAVFTALVLEKSKPKNAPQQGAEGESASATSTQQYHWKMVTSWPKNTPGLGVGAENLARAINEMSGGRLQIHV